MPVSASDGLDSMNTLLKLQQPQSAFLIAARRPGPLEKQSGNTAQNN